MEYKLMELLLNSTGGILVVFILPYVVFIYILYFIKEYTRSLEKTIDKNTKAINNLIMILVKQQDIDIDTDNKHVENIMENEKGDLDNL